MPLQLESFESVRDFAVRGPGHQLLLPPANWCPIFAVWTTQGKVADQFGAESQLDILVHNAATKQVGRHGAARLLVARVAPHEQTCWAATRDTLQRPVT